MLCPLLLLWMGAVLAEDDPPTEEKASSAASHEVTLDLAEGTWMNVSVSRDTLVFDLLGDLWTLPLAGGEATRLTSGPAWDGQPRFSPAGRRIAYVSDASGSEQVWIMDADGEDARQLTRDEEARIGDPVWDPKGPYILARRRMIDTRSVGTTELWQYHLDGGKGFALTDDGPHPHAGEAATDGVHVWFSSRNGRFDYNQDPVAGLWKIMRLARRSSELWPVVTGAGSAARPTLSPDGRLLAFITRDRDETNLELLEVSTGRRRVLADWLSPDQMEGFALRGTYPAMDWTEDSASLVLWARGKLWRVGLDGARREIPFRAKGTWTMRDVQRWPRRIPEEVQARVLRWPVWGPRGQLAFSAMGALWIREKSGEIVRISDGTGYAPAWRPDGQALAWTSWADMEPVAGGFPLGGGALYVDTFGWRGQRETLPVSGQLLNPAWSEDGRQLAVLRGVGGDSSPDLNAEPWFEILVLSRRLGRWTVESVATTSNRGPGSRAPRLYLRDGRIWYFEDREVEGGKPPETVLTSVKNDGSDKRTHLRLPGAEEVVPSPDFSKVAYKLAHQVHVSALPLRGEETKVEDLPSIRLTKIVGDWLTWTADGSALSWVAGSTVYTRKIESLEKDGDDEPKGVGPLDSVQVDLRLPRARPAGKRALVHARAITMRGAEIVDDATIVIDQDRIVSLTPRGAPPPDAEVIDCTGLTVIPGLIDVHYHSHYTASDILPEQEWRYLAALDFGVTTVHDPSAPTDLVFTQAERVEAGFEQGPRIFSTGSVLYGALSNQAAITPTAESAYHHVQRLKMAGAGSVKVYQQTRREQRRWYADACHDEQALCVAEGGGDMWQMLSMVADGYHAVEHAIPHTPLYADVRQFWAASAQPETGQLGAAYTPTLLVAYGGLFGENFYYQYHNPIDDERLLRHHPRRLLDSLAWRRSVLARDWSFQGSAQDAARMARDGVLVALGSHGQLQGLGVHWELWAMAGPSALTPHEALQAATINGARYLGLEQEIGSIEPGKLADLVALQADPLAEIQNTTRIAFVIKNGAVVVSE